MKVPQHGQLSSHDLPGTRGSTQKHIIPYVEESVEGLGLCWIEIMEAVELPVMQAVQGGGRADVNEVGGPRVRSSA